MTYLEFFFKPMVKYLKIPTTNIFPPGKSVWNIGNHNPYLKQGFILVCCNFIDSYKMNPDTLEAVFVGGYKNAKILSDAADITNIGISYINDMEDYINKQSSTAAEKLRQDNMKEAIAIVQHFAKPEGVE